MISGMGNVLLRLPKLCISYELVKLLEDVLFPEDLAKKKSIILKFIFNNQLDSMKWKISVREQFDTKYF